MSKRMTQRVLIFASPIFGLVPANLAAQGNGGGVTAITGHVNSQMMNAQPVGANWLSYNGDYTGRRFSSLDQITAKNVEQLRAQWIFHVANSGNLEVTPVVVDGLMLVTSAN